MNSHVFPSGCNSQMASAKARFRRFEMTRIQVVNSPHLDKEKHNRLLARCSIGSFLLLGRAPHA